MYIKASQPEGSQVPENAPGKPAASSGAAIKYTAVGVSLLLMIGLIDYTTGPEIAFSLFYLIPICIVIRKRGRTAGIVMSLLAAAVWVSVDVLSGQGYSHFLIPYWNGTVRLGFFLAVTFLLSGLLTTLERQSRIVAREQHRMYVALMEEAYQPVREILGNLSLLDRRELSLTARLSVDEIQKNAQQIQETLLRLKEFGKGD